MDWNFLPCVNLELPAWKEAVIPKEKCPQCAMQTSRDELLHEGCPWCGWESDRMKAAAEV